MGDILGAQQSLLQHHHHHHNRQEQEQEQHHHQHPYYTIYSRPPHNGLGARQPDGPAAHGIHDGSVRTATHDISRTSFHVKHIAAFAQRLEHSAMRAFPNTGRASQRYNQVQALLLHWGSDDLFVLPELEDLEKCLRQEFAFGTDIFAIPSENSHLELMMRVGQLIKDYESQDTLFLIYYGGHARIDESRQSTWCASRDESTPWLQWSAIQTLLERSKSDVLILLDCCAGAASATFPSGHSITETISASSWDAIAPDPGRYSFTNALIEVLQEWRLRTFSAAMLHAEVLARLKHPRPITINGKYFEARSTPVHFMMTANHKAPSIELSRLLPSERKPEPDPFHRTPPLPTGRAADTADTATPVGPVSHSHVGAMSEPNEDTPHVMLSLALEEDQRLDIHAWEQWLSAFPSIAKYVKVQGVFKSHSNLMLISLPVMVWDLLPEDPALSFVAFIRSNNLAVPRNRPEPRTAAPVPAHQQQGRSADDNDNLSIATGVSGTTLAGTDCMSVQQFRVSPSYSAPSRQHHRPVPFDSSRIFLSGQPTTGVGFSKFTSSPSLGGLQRPMGPAASATSHSLPHRQVLSPSLSTSPSISQQMIVNQQQSMRRTALGTNVPEPKKFSPHVERRLEAYYQEDHLPNDAHSAIMASNLGIELWHLEAWFHHRRERDVISDKLASMKLRDTAAVPHSGPGMILPADLDRLLELSLPGDGLLFDVRSASEYGKSHIYGAIHLRAPKKFLQAAPLDLIEHAVPDEVGRSQLANWPRAKWLVLYGRGLENPQECPTADLMYQKLHAKGWQGHCFVLRGHYQEFSQSFGKHIVGTKITQEAKDRISGRATAVTTAVDRQRVEHQYSQWLDHVVGQDRARPPSTPPPDRLEAVEMQERELEKEFSGRCASLFRKAMDLQPVDDCDTWNASKAEMVEYLDCGLDKMRAHAYQPPSHTFAPQHSKMASGDYSEGFFGSGSGGKGSQEHDFDADYVQVNTSDGPTTAGTLPPGRTPQSDNSVKGSGGGGGGGGSLLNKMFRR